MDLENKTIVILGGSGLVGHAIAHKLVDYRPAKIVLVALFETEVREAAASLEAVRGSTQIESDWGNVFLPAKAAKETRTRMLEDASLRRLVIDDLLGTFSPAILKRSFLYELLTHYQPDAVIDCINTATAFAYQDVFSSARELVHSARAGSYSLDAVEKHVLTLTMPQLIRHVQIAVESMRSVGTAAYVKIGTSGTGGMGLNIPYTHSEERPSRTLLTKSAVAGAHSLLLFLVSRTPDAPTAIEIKPTSAIAWRKIAYGPVRRGGQPIRRVDCPNALAIEAAFAEGASGWQDTGSVVESVYIDVGENGVFARDEFDTVTSLGQMEFITPEEVADYVVAELQGRATGRDVVAALDSATAGPTYRAGVLRSAALARLRRLEEEHGLRSVAFEMLGPPRLTKMLYESHVWSLLRRSIRALATSDAHSLSQEAAALIASDADLRSLIISIGLPIIVDGEKIYRAEKVLLPLDGGDVDRVASRGWVDLRSVNCARWIARAEQMVAQAEAHVAGETASGSGIDWYVMEADNPIVPARFATWVFRHEEDGVRIKR